MRQENTSKPRLLTPESNGKNRALVLGGGCASVGFIAGFLSKFSETIKPSFFKKIYPVSGSVYPATYYVSRQLDAIENAWRNLIDGHKLVNIFGPIFGEPMLKLEYLTELSRNGDTKLNVQAVLSGNNPTYAITELKTGIPIYKTPRNEEELIALMEASSALPVRKATRIDGIEYVDGTLSVGAFPIEIALKEGHDEILVLSTRPKGYYDRYHLDMFSRPFALYTHWTGQPMLSKLCRAYGSRQKETHMIARNNPDRVELVEPKEQILKHTMDCDNGRLNATVNLGIQQASEWLYRHGY